MTLIVLAVLAAAWMAYFALWFRERRASGPRRSDGVVDTSHYSDRSLEAERIGARIRLIRARPWPERPVSAANKSGSDTVATQRTLTHSRSLLDAVSRERVSFAGVGDGAKNLGDLLESPRTRQQALRRRRHVATVLIAVAIASLLAVPVFGPTALSVHVMVDVGLILFAFGTVHRQQPPAVSLADVRVLYPDRPAPSDATAMPLGRVANG